MSNLYGMLEASARLPLRTTWARFLAGRPCGACKLHGFWQARACGACKLHGFWQARPCGACKLHGFWQARPCRAGELHGFLQARPSGACTLHVFWQARPSRACNLRYIMPPERFEHLPLRSEIAFFTCFCKQSSCFIVKHERHKDT